MLFVSLPLLCLGFTMAQAQQPFNTDDAEVTDQGKTRTGL